MSTTTPRRTPRQWLKKNWRDLRVLLRAFSRPLLLFLGTLIVAGLLYWFLADLSDMPEKPGVLEAIFLVLQMIFLQANMSFPEPWYLQLFLFLMPIIGIVLLSAGAANLGVKLFNKSARGQDWEVALASTYSDHVIVCGLGKLGYRVVLQLLEFGQTVVAIEREADKYFIPLVRERDVPVIIGDARQRELLRKAGIERASAVVCSTQDELANLDIALDARELHPDIKVVLRMFDETLASKVEKGFGIHTAFSMSALSAPAFAAAATRAHIDYSFYVGGTLLHVSQVNITRDSPLLGLTLETAEQQFDLTIVMHQANDELHLHPASEEVIAENDTLVVFATLDTLGRIGGNNHPGAYRHGGRNFIKRLFGHKHPH
ncbi:Voltage-gated potassium channel Kch [Thermoflexales bacterium]|nr:Voltage-gated potassium channel Kch [Thermoflexales bacterium]